MSACRPLATLSVPLVLPSNCNITTTATERAFRSKSRNTPFGGWTLKGRVERTILGGRTVYER